MIKELWILIKMLFGKGPKDIGRVSLMNMKHFPCKGFAYLMWCGKMIYRDDMYDRRQKEWATDVYKVKVNHETIHLMQAKAKGSWWRFYLSYAWNWMKHNPITHPSHAAYYLNKYECEAYANEENMDYCKHYNADNIKKYEIKHAKRIFKNLGDSEAWKAYVKTL